MAANKVFPIQVTNKNGLDMDSDPSQVANGDYTYALNARVHSSNKYDVPFADSTVIPFNLGDRRAIKPYFGEATVTLDWINNAGEPLVPPTVGTLNLNEDFTACGVCEGNGSRNIGYFVILKTLLADNPFIAICYFSQGVNQYLQGWEYAGLAEDILTNYNATGICQIDDYLYFIDPLNIPVKYYVGAEAGVQKTVRTLIKYKPVGAPELINAAAYFVQGNQINRIEGNTPDGVQFAYTYKWYDNTETPLSYFSEVYPVIVRSDSPFEVYRLKHSEIDDPNDNGELLFERGVKSLLFYYRLSDTGLWKSIDEFILDGVTNVQVLFYPTNDGGIALPTNKQNKYFEAIPITSKALETVNGRIFLGNNRMSYTPVVVPSTSAYDIAIGGSTAPLNSTDIFTQDKLKSIKAGGRYNIGVYGIDEYGRPTGITRIGTVTIPRKNSIIEQTTRDNIVETRDFQNVLTAGISNAVTFPEGITRYGFALTKCLNISLFLTGIAKWQYYYIPNTTTGVTNPYTGYALADAWGPNLTSPKPAPTGIAIILNAGEAYQWQQGDRFYVNIGYYVDDTGIVNTFPTDTRYDFEIIAAFGNVLMLDQASAANWYLRTASNVSNPNAYDIQHVAYEIYRPTNDATTSNLYYAATEPALISELTSDPADNVKILEGDVMLVPYGYSAVFANKIIYNQGYQYVAIANLDVAVNENFTLETRQTKKLPILLFKECTTWSVNFPYDQTWNNRTLGWVNQPLTINSQIPLDSTTHICFSDTKIAATEIDGTGNFDALNYTIYPQEYGPISKLIRVSDNQLESNGAILMALFQKEAVSIYISRVTLQEITGVAQVLLSDKILGSFNAQLGSCGCINPESVVRQDNRVYFWDGTKKRVIRYSRDGLTAISEFGMSTYFGQMDKPLKVYSGYDYNNNELYLTFKNEFQLEAPTTVWNETENRWVTLHTVNPEFYGTNGEYSNFTYFIGGVAKAFTDIENPSRFNINQLVTPIIDFVVNPELLTRKNLMAVWLQKGFTAKEGDIDLEVSFSKGYDYFSDKTQVTAITAAPQDNFDGQELLQYSFGKIKADQIRDYNETDPIQKGNKYLAFFYGILRISLGQMKRGIYAINLQYQSQNTPT